MPLGITEQTTFFALCSSNSQFQFSFRQFSLGREFELFIQCELIGYFIVTIMPDRKIINIIFITNAVKHFLILFQETGTGL